MKKHIQKIIILLASVIATSLSAEDAKWSYSGETGPENWAEISEDYALCKTGKNQSPVNIDLKATASADKKGIKFNYGLIIPDSIVNNGKFIQADVSMGTDITVDDIEFELKSLQFHMPSENTVDGQHFPMEVQFVHESKKKELAYVSMMFIPGRQNRLLSKILEELPAEVGKEEHLSGNSLRSIEMRKKLDSYYRYNGSMTTPPCSEGVRWFIMKQNQSLSKEQYAAFKAAMKEDNNRPVQPLNARIIME
jgi:carbonic anhydrase